jgi:hypothetical protein
MYHPDKDPSLDGEMRYKEIRAAYDALRLGKNRRPSLSHAPKPSQSPRQSSPSSKRHGRAAGAGPGEPFTDARRHQDYGTGGSKGWWYVEEDEVFDFSDLMWEYGGRKAPKKRVTFGLEALPRILWESFKEVTTFGMAIRWAMTLWGLWTLFETIKLSPLLAGVIIFCTSIGALFFRYYDDSPIQVPTVKMLGSMLYSLGIGALCVMFSHQMMVMGTVRDRWGIPRREIVTADNSVVFILVVLFTFFALLPLWAHPLAWMENAVNSNKTTWPR